MKTTILLFAALLIPRSAAAEDPNSETVFRALVDEMKRTVSRLEMEKLGKPYFVAYTAMDSKRLSISSSFGGIKDPHLSRSRHLKVELRVGDRKFDNTHYAGKDYWGYRPHSGGLVTDADYDAIRYGIWQITDRAYKEALERLSQKKAYKQSKMIKEEIPDLSKEPVGVSEEPVAEVPFERELWEKRLRKLSAVFKKYPAIQRSYVNLYWTQRRHYFVDSEGRRVLKPKHDFELVIGASTQAEDGMRLSDRRDFIRRRLEDMPPFSLLEAEVTKFAEDLSNLTTAPLLEEDYIVPMLLLGKAAGEFFNQLLAHNIAFPREIWVQEEHARKEFHTGGLTGRLGLRVVSRFLSAEDDPGLKSFEGIPLLGHYRIDDEGVPAQRVALIEKGILKDLLMSRAPTKKRANSTGHGRGAQWEFPTAHISNLVISSEKTMPLSELKDELRKQAREFGLDFGVVIRRLRPENAQEKNELLAAPVMVFKVDVKTGKETLMRNAKFSGVTLRALRDIVATSAKRHVYNYYQLGPYKASGRGQVQASIVHPSVLVAEMELKKSDKKPDKLPYLKHPHFN